MLALSSTTSARCPCRGSSSVWPAPGQALAFDPENRGEFSARGPRDSKGRSLRDLDLQTRMMKYPCSHLVYSASFDSLPDEAKERVYRRMFDVLTGQDESQQFSHLSGSDRTAIIGILRETKSDLPDYWNQST